MLLTNTQTGEGWRFQCIIVSWRKV